MKVYFAIRPVGYETEDVFGPFAKRRIAADFIEKEEENSEYAPWWDDNWYIAEVEIAESWEDWTHLRSYIAKEYRPAYCKEQRRIRHEQWRKDNPEKAAYEDKWMDNFMRSMEERLEPTDILDNLQFGQEIEINIGRKKIQGES